MIHTKENCTEYLLPLNNFFLSLPHQHAQYRTTSTDINNCRLIFLLGQKPNQIKSNQTKLNSSAMKFSPSTVLALAAVVATGTTAFAPLSRPSKSAVANANSKNNYNSAAFQRPVSFLKSTETETADATAPDAETFEYVTSIYAVLCRVVSYRGMSCHVMSRCRSIWLLSCPLSISMSIRCCHQQQQFGRRRRFL